MPLSFAKSLAHALGCFCPLLMFIFSSFILFSHLLVALFYHRLFIFYYSSLSSSVVASSPPPVPMASAISATTSISLFIFACFAFPAAFSLLLPNFFLFFSLLLQVPTTIGVRHHIATENGLAQLVGVAITAKARRP